MRYAKINTIPFLLKALDCNSDFISTFNKTLDDSNSDARYLGLYCYLLNKLVQDNSLYKTYCATEIRELSYFTGRIDYTKTISSNSLSRGCLCQPCKVLSVYNDFNFVLFWVYFHIKEIVSSDISSCTSLNKLINKFEKSTNSIYPEMFEKSKLFFNDEKQALDYLHTLSNIEIFGKYYTYLIRFAIMHLEHYIHSKGYLFNDTSFSDSAIMEFFTKSCVRNALRSIASKDEKWLRGSYSCRDCDRIVKGNNSSLYDVRLDVPILFKDLNPLILEVKTNHNAFNKSKGYCIDSNIHQLYFQKCALTSYRRQKGLKNCNTNGVLFHYFNMFEYSKNEDFLREQKSYSGLTVNIGTDMKEVCWGYYMTETTTTDEVQAFIRVKLLDYIRTGNLV